MSRTAALVAAVLGLLALGSGTAQAARTVDVVLTAAEPTVVTIAAGDTVRFVNGEQGPLAPPHTVTSTERDGSTPWQFDSGALGPGASAPFTFAQPGSYVYVDRRGLVAPAERLGRIVVTAPPGPSPAPAGRTAAPAPTPAAAPPPPPGTAAPAPAAAAAPAPLPPLVGGVQTAPLGGLPPLPGTAPSVAGAPVPVTAPPATALPVTALPAVQALPGPLPGAPTDRGLGLPATLAALAAAGVGSLLVRVLLAEPAARRRPVPAAVG